MNLAEKFIKTKKLEIEEYERLIRQAEENPDLRELLTREAVRIRKKHYRTDVYIRGLIEFTNYCKNDCYYCGIRRGNKNVVRYRLKEEEILNCCEQGYRLGFRTFVLQGGEDAYYTDERMAEIIKMIKKRHPDCAVTLSIGERSFESYKYLREAGADRYLLRHETADERLYASIHPEELTLKKRKKCLSDLKRLGYQVGAGFMVGVPGQEIRHLAEDLAFLEELRPQMVGIGPFIPHHDTMFAKEPAGSVERTLLMLSVIRILLPTALLPATTALGTADRDGREKGLQAGANVVMPNLSPLKNRRQYELYDNKICTGEEAAESVAVLSEKVRASGYEIVVSRGDCLKE